MILDLTHAFLHVKVIAISRVPDTANALDSAKLLRVWHTLYKPFSMEVLLQTVQYELAHRTGTEAGRWRDRASPSHAAAVRSIRWKILQMAGPNPWQARLVPDS